MGLTMGRVIQFDQNTDNGPLTTAVGDTPHITADQSFHSMPGDLHETTAPIPGTCWICAVTWVLAGLFIGCVLMFVGNLLVDIAKRMVP
jgi:hypothetical protein